MIILMRGPHGAGKTAALQGLKDSMIVSTSKMRELYAGSADDQRIGSIVSERVHEIVDSRSKLGLVSVVDSTNARIKSIKPYKQIADTYGIPLHVVDIDVADVDSLMANIKRRCFEFGGDYVPQSVVERAVYNIHTARDSVIKYVGEHFFHTASNSEIAEGIIEDLIDTTQIGQVLDVSEHTWCVGDIHGCRHTFHALMTKLQFAGAENVIILGDMVDRGPDSVGVVDDIRTMIDYGFYGIRVRAIRGNHDHMFYLEEKHGHECRSKDRAVTHQQFSEQPTACRERVIDTIEKLPHMMYLKHEPENGSPAYVLLTHAGLDLPISGTLSNRAATSCANGRALTLDERAMFRDIQEKDGLIQVFGHRHWDYKDDIDPLFANIDSGAVYGKCLTAYNPFTKQVLRQDLIDEVTLMESK
jgi:predicted kinase